MIKLSEISTKAPKGTDEDEIRKKTRSIAKEIDGVYEGNNAQDIRKIEFRIENKKIIANVTFLS